MKAVLLNINDGTRFHLGKAMGAFTEETNNSQKTTSDYIHSDTLWSALVNAWALRCPGTVDDFVSECKTRKFLISSAFYYFVNSKNGDKNSNIFFLPKPASLNLYKFSEPKKLKKIRFISKGVWEKGILPNDWFNSDICTLIQNDSAVALKSETDKSFELFHIETAAKTSARDITDREDAFYFQTDLFLAKNVKWYFLLDNQLSEHLQADFEKAMQTFIVLGIGGERSTGCGALSGFEIIDFNFDMSESGKDKQVQVSLSLTIPKKDDLSENDLYQIIKRGGRFLTKGKSLPMIQMLQEGAVLNNDFTGKIVGLNSNPIVLRYGLKFSAPLHQNFSNF
ncbi:MAG TPA: type III-A CRISPR-associated RAMP protein Csm4 [Bacteroidales bacterium]|nr:type III-A CRISPR-associated RAMP protein Csm4 [Bacteroidales bacterium]